MKQAAAHTYLSGFNLYKNVVGCWFTLSYDKVIVSFFWLTDATSQESSLFEVGLKLVKSKSIELSINHLKV